MKIVPIIEGKLYSFQFPNQKLNEYERMFKLWLNREYIQEFVFQNKNHLTDSNIESFADDIFDDVELMKLSIKENTKGRRNTLDRCFVPLYNSEYKEMTLWLHKKRAKYLRLYAIRIAVNLFIITGGAIKITQKMQQHPDTNKERIKLNNCKAFLQSKSIFDDESFYEFFNS